MSAFAWLTDGLSAFTKAPEKLAEVPVAPDVVVAPPAPPSLGSFEQTGSELAGYLAYLGIDGAAAGEALDQRLADPAFQAHLAAESARLGEEEKRRDAEAKRIASEVDAAVGLTSDEDGLLDAMVGMDADMLARVRSQWPLLYPDRPPFDDFVRTNAAGDASDPETEAFLAGDPGRAAAFSLKRAMAGAGTDLALIEKTFAALDDEQRQQAIATFNAEVGVDSGAFYTDLTLGDWLDSDLDGEDYQRMVALMNGDEAGERAVRLGAAEAGHWFSTDATDQATQEQILAECDNEEARRALLRRHGVMDGAEYTDEAASQKAGEDLGKHVASEGLPDFLQGFLAEDTFAGLDAGSRHFAVAALATSGDAAIQDYVTALQESESFFDFRQDNGKGMGGRTLDHDVLIGLAEGDTAGATAAMLARAKEDGDPEAFGKALATQGKTWEAHAALSPAEQVKSDLEFDATMAEVRARFETDYGGGAGSYQQALADVAGDAIDPTTGRPHKERTRLDQLDADGRMTRGFQAFYAMDGLGTHDDLLADAFAGTDTAEAQAVGTDYAAISEAYTGATGHTLLGDIEADTSGDLDADTQLAATYGDHPTGFAAKLAKEKGRRAYDATGLDSVIGLFTHRDEELDRRGAEMADLEARFAGGDASAEAELDTLLDAQALDRASWRKDRDAIADRAATIASAAATLATLGAGGMVSALVGGMAKMVTSDILKGDANSDADVALDVGSTALQVATAGIGAKLGPLLTTKYGAKALGSASKTALLQQAPTSALGFASNGVVGTAMSGYAEKGIDYDFAGYWEQVAQSGAGSVLDLGGNVFGAGLAGLGGLGRSATAGLSSGLGGLAQGAAAYDASNPFAAFDVAMSTATSAATGYHGAKLQAGDEPTQTVEEALAQMKQKLPPGLSNEEVLEARGFTDEEGKLLVGARNSEAQGSKSIDKPNTPVDEQAVNRPDLNFDGTARAALTDDEKQAILRNAVLQLVDVEAGADGRKVVPESDVGTTLGGKGVTTRGTSKTIENVTGDMGLLRTTLGKLPESICRILGLDYGRYENDEFKPNAGFGVADDDAHGNQAAKVADEIKQNGLYAMDFKYTDDLIGQLKVPAGADMADYMKKVAGWFHADGIEDQAPWLLQLAHKNGGDVAAAVAAGKWDELVLPHVHDRERGHKYDPSTGKMFSASHTYDAHGELEFEANVELTIDSATADAGKTKIPAGATLKKIGTDGKEKVIATYDGSAWVLDDDLSDADEAKYQALTQQAGAAYDAAKAAGK